MIENQFIVKSHVNKIPHYVYWLIILVSYIVLFEFIFPFNNVLPKPSLLPEAIVSLFKDYDFLFNLFYSASGVYLSIILGYLIVSLLSAYLIGLLINTRNFIQSLWIFKFFPLIGVLTIFIFWFPGSNISEYILSISFSLVYFTYKLNQELPKVREEYINSALTMGADKSELLKDIFWKSCQPGVFRSIINLHLILWTITVFFEYIKSDLGIGKIFKMALEFKDISALLTISVVFVLILIIGESILKYLNKKIIYWEG